MSKDVLNAVALEVIVSAIADNIDVREDLIQRAIDGGYAERVEYITLTADGRYLLREYDRED